ncbi:MAG: Kynureninase [Rhodanobacteraceae bacterium]|jgi:kynureninase|nr:MAG: Kynureninase [Rhodanobacteraceae bacterium]
MAPTGDFRAEAGWARAQDDADPLRAFRDEFLIPPHAGGEQTYLVGNSLGLQPRGVRQALLDELDDWAQLGVEGHLHARHPWLPYHKEVRDGLAEVVGAEPSEVVAMNSLTANLHLLMVSFYRPTRERHAILIERHAFPSDRDLVASQIRFHGFDPAEALIELDGDEPGGAVSMAAIERALAEHGKRIALVLWPGVQYLTGQVFDLKAITRLAHAQGCIAGFDCAHAAGNLALALHDSGCDFAAWCSYKYLNSGPGAVAGAFVHARHAHAKLPRFEGWWGRNEATRFQMRPEFEAAPGADGWQLSNPPILALAPLRVSLDLFQRAGMPRLREKSKRLTAYLAWLIETQLGDTLEILTPSGPDRRGAQLSVRVRAGRDAGQSLFDFMTAHGVLGDWREPDVMRIAPAPLYNTFADCLRYAESVKAWRSRNA